jgi:hypothetical protein
MTHAAAKVFITCARFFIISAPLGWFFDSARRSLDFRWKYKTCEARRACRSMTSPPPGGKSAILSSPPGLPRVALFCYDEMMKTISEIEDAIEKLPSPQVAELAAWIEAFRVRAPAPQSLERWLERARGAARPGATTDNIMALTRGEE